MRLPIEIVALVYRFNGNSIEYLLFKRIEAKGGFWAPVSGGYEESDRDLLSACHRELKEEIDLDESNIRSTSDCVYIHQFTVEINKEKDKNYRSLNSNKLTLTDFAFGFEVSDEFEPKLIEEHSEYRWVSLDEAKSLFKYDTQYEELKSLNDVLVAKRS